MQTSISMNMLALVDSEPRVLTLKRLLSLFLRYRQDVLTRRTQFELEKARARAHILEGLKIALDHVDAIIRLIRQAASAEAAQHQLMERYKLTEVQARAILDLQLRRLAALERQEILDEYERLLKTIARLEDLLANPVKILYLVRDELVDLKKKYGDARRTLVAADQTGDISQEEIIPNIEVLITISSRGYIKRLPSDTYQRQRRGGKGIKGMMLREEDALRHMVVANAHDSMLFFTDRGRVFQLKAHQIPDGGPHRQGTPDRESHRRRSAREDHRRPGGAELRARLSVDGDQARRDQEDAPPGLCDRPVERADRDGPRAGRRAGLGQALDPRLRADHR